MQSPVAHPETVEQRRGLSGFAQVLCYLGGTAWIYALFVGITAATGYRFEITADGVENGIPLPDTWFHFGLLVAVGAALWMGGRKWDAPRFVALRTRRPWLVPVLGVFVLLPASLALLFWLVS